MLRSWRGVGHNGVDSRVQHRLKQADDDQHGGGSKNTVRKEQRDKAHPDAGRRNNQNGPSAHAVGNAADKRRGQQLAPGIAAEQQANKLHRDGGRLLRPQREKRHNRAVDKADNEIEDKAQNVGLAVSNKGRCKECHDITQVQLPRMPGRICTLDNVNVYDLREAGAILANRQGNGNCEFWGLVVGGGFGVVLGLGIIVGGKLSRRYFLWVWVITA